MKGATRLRAGTVAAVLLVLVLAPFVARPGSSAQTGAVGCEDVLVVGEITYRASDLDAQTRWGLGRPLAATDLGPAIGRVDGDQVSRGTATPIGQPGVACPSEPGIWATELPLGTPIYGVVGYALTFRLAAQLADGRVVLYEAATSTDNPTARTGGELFDIGGRVTSVSMFTVENVPIGTIADPAQVEEAVGYVMGARVARRDGIDADKRPRLVVYQLADGTVTSDRWYPSTNELSSGVVVPAGYGRLLQAAFPAQAPDEKPAMRWSVHVGRDIAVPPVVVDGVVYAVGRAPDDRNLVAAYDAATGVERWRAEVGDPTVFLGAPPAVVDNRVYLALGDGTVLALSAESGEVRWRSPGPPNEVSTMGTTPAVAGGLVYVAHGAGSSGPTVVDGLVVVGGDRRTRVVAFDADTGTLRWATSVEDDPTSVGEVSGYWAYDAATGAKRWHAPTGAVRNHRAVAHEGTLWITSEPAMPRFQSGSVNAIDPATGQPLSIPGFGGWSILAPPAVAEGAIFVDTGNVLVAIDFAGTFRWTAPHEGPVPSDDSPVLAAGVLYVGNPDGHVTAYDAATGAVRWCLCESIGVSVVETVPEQTAPGLAVDGKTLFVATAYGAVIAYDLAADTGPTTTAPIVPADDAAATPDSSTPMPTVPARGTPTSGTPTVGPEPCVLRSVVSWAIDVGDDRALAEHATDIFVGRVVGQTGDVGVPTSLPGDEIAQSQFAVEVLEAVKGAAAGTVTVNQHGGIEARTGCLVLLEEDELLRPGEEALFVTRFSADNGWYSITAGQYAHLTIGDEAERAALVARFAAALGTPVAATPTG